MVKKRWLTYCYPIQKHASYIEKHRHKFRDKPEYPYAKSFLYKLMVNIQHSYWRILPVGIYEITAIMKKEERKENRLRHTSACDL